MWTSVIHFSEFFRQPSQKSCDEYCQWACNIYRVKRQTNWCKGSDLLINNCKSLWNSAHALANSRGCNHRTLWKLSFVQATGTSLKVIHTVRGISTKAVDDDKAQCDQIAAQTLQCSCEQHIVQPHALSKLYWWSVSSCKSISKCGPHRWAPYGLKRCTHKY